MSKSYSTDRHANARDRKRANAKKMVVTNRGIFTIQRVIGKKAAGVQIGQCLRHGHVIERCCPGFEPKDSSWSRSR